MDGLWKGINSSDLSTGSNWNWINVILAKGDLIENWFDITFYKNILSNFLIQHLNPFTFILSIYAIAINFKSKDPIIKFHINWILSNLLFLFIFAELILRHPYYQIFFRPQSYIFYWS